MQQIPMTVWRRTIMARIGFLKNVRRPENY